MGKTVANRIDPYKKTALESADDALTSQNDALVSDDPTTQSIIDKNNTIANEQIKTQEESTQLTIDKLDQQMEKAEQSYQDEKNEAYADYLKQIDPYGANAENLASIGLQRSGYAESSRVKMYTAYQNRVALARQGYEQLKVEYENGIREAKLLNSSAIAKIKAETYTANLELYIEGLANAAEKIKTQYYSGDINKDAYTYDVFSNGYQPKGIEGYGHVYDTGKTYSFNTETVGGEMKTVVQKVWKTQDGSEWLWDGKQNKYVPYERSNKRNVNTPYYIGELNADAKTYGTFANEYQPKGISGHGYLTKTGDKTLVETETLEGEAKFVNQNIWVAADGTKWIWNGKKNKYDLYSKAKSPDDVKALEGHGRIVKRHLMYAITQDGTKWKWNQKKHEYVKVE